MNTYCTKANCKLAANCLRYTKMSEEEHDVISIINPRLLAKNEECPYFVTSEKVRAGKGFIQMLRRLPRMQEDAFRLAMIAEYPRNKYFKLRRGEILCMPNDQAIIQRVLTRLGLPTDNIYDAWEECQMW